MTPNSHQPDAAPDAERQARLARLGYRLLPVHVPAPPQSDLFIDTMRWCVAVLDPGSRDIEEAARLLDKTIRRPGLMPPEARRAEAVFDRTREAWARGALTFQRPLDLTNVVTLAGRTPAVPTADQPDLFEVKQHG